MNKMKRIINTLICMEAALFSLSCQEELIIDKPVAESIILDLSSGELTKAADENHESYVKHIDVLVFTVGSDDKPAGCFYHEKITVNNTSTVSLAARRSDFGENTKYFVYIVANSSNDFTGVTDFSDLNNLMQEDPLLHLTALNLGEGVDNPQYFLMDAVATDTSGNSPLVLNDGNVENDTELKAVLRRAAAKVYINITAGEKVTFRNYGVADGSEGGLYYIRNLPYDTYVLAETKSAASIINAKVTTTAKTDSEYFTWHPEIDDKNVTLVAYVYPHHWENASILERETCIVMNLPMDFIDGEGNTVPYHNSWYKIPMTDNATFERNHYYAINIDLNRPGAISESEPVKMEELYYSVQEWTGVEINAGGINGPNYLQLNTDHVDMYNVNTDSESLTFASSSEINRIELLEAYHYDYLDRKINVPSNVTISAIAESGVLNGGIMINSPFVGMTEEEKQAEIVKLTKPQLTVAKPEEPAGKPVPPTEVANPGDTQPENPNNDETLNEIAEKYSSNGIMGWGAYTVSWTRNADGYPEFSVNSRWSNADEYAQDEFDELWAIYTDYNSKKAAYDAYLIEYSNYEAALATWQAENSGYIAELAAYEAAYAQYQTDLTAYNEAVAAINNSSGDTHENAIRYMTFKVYNNTGQEATFTVAQYPTIYITNKKGAYSYRSDFGGTNYTQRGNPNRSGANWDNGEWEYGSEASGEFFFGSKVALGSEGNYTINYAYWNNNNSLRTSNISSLDNPRMYHVHVTATSAMYTVAVPRLDSNNYTESSAENTILVSPSFMIASQLGATMTPSGGISQAKSHCEQYIEVGADGTIYDDWRLPTAAEIDIIIQHQDISDAMAVVLTGTAYYCAYNTDANGNVIYTKATGKNGGQNAVRCIRDAY